MDLRNKRASLDECNAKQAMPQFGGMVGSGDVPRRSIRRRIDEALLAAEHTARRAEAAYRAKNIIDQHPEFAELLEALNEF
jgi:hypothetical protein